MAVSDPLPSDEKRTEALSSSGESEETLREVLALTDALQANQSELLSIHRRLKRLLPQIEHPVLRGKLQRDLWLCETSAGARPGYFSRAGQDWWLDKHAFKRKRKGTFIDIGGFDGLIASNTLFFELVRGWRGLLLEPSPTLFKRASRIRRCRCLQRAIAPEVGRQPFLHVLDGYLEMGGLMSSYDEKTHGRLSEHPKHREETIEVETLSLEALFQEFGLTEVDYISLDVEGAEVPILESFPFERFPVQAWTVETRLNKDAIDSLMQSKGYRRAETLADDAVYLLEAK